MSSGATGVHTEIDPQNLQNPVLAFLKDYWDRKRGKRAMPARGDIRPSEMKEHLRWIILLDVLPGAEDFRLRTVGTRVTEYFLTDSTGKTVTDAFARYGDDAVRAILATHRKVARDAVALRVYGGAGMFGRAFLDFDALYLPLSGDGTSVNMILSAFTFDLSELLKVRPAQPPNRL